MESTRTLNNGYAIPVLGLGTWKVEKDTVGHGITYAITHGGYRHIDCASIYGNEKEIGEAVTNVLHTVVTREELFITSKLWNTDHRSEHVEKACKKTLSDLQLDYLDLYLMHWGIAFPYGGALEPLDKRGKVITERVSIQETWQAMEALVKKGLVKSIGVANFTTMMLVDLLSYATITPVMNQIELHPYNTQNGLVNFCTDKNIAVTAYSPLGHGGSTLQNERVIKRLADTYKKTPTQILLNWAVSRGTIAIPKSIHPHRIKENIDIFDFHLTNKEQHEMSLLNKNERFIDPNDWWGIPYFA